MAKTLDHVSPETHESNPKLKRWDWVGEVGVGRCGGRQGDGIRWGVAEVGR